MRLVAAPLAVAVLVAAAPAFALEKTAARFHARAEWSRGIGTYSISYYNACTGWVWVWSGWDAGERLGVVYENPCFGDPEWVTGSRVFVQTGAPSGYGYTGTVEVSVANADGTPGDLLAQQPFLPATGWNELEWFARLRGDLGFTMTATLGPGAKNPAGFVTDHPAAVPGGPPPCGTCYPTTRESHSYVFGSDGGTPFHDGTCDAELLFEAAVFCQDLHSPVTPVSWGAIKNLYR